VVDNCEHVVAAAAALVGTLLAAAPGLTPETAPVVARICERLDRLPLAIELAATRVRSLSLAEIAVRLDTSLGLLDEPRGGGEARHRTISSRW
jgi:predicted ATPase